MNPLETWRKLDPRLRAVLIALAVLVAVAWLVLDVADRAGAEWARKAKTAIASWFGFVLAVVIAASMLFGAPWYVGAGIAVAALTLTPTGRLVTALATRSGGSSASEIDALALCSGAVPGVQVITDDSGATIGYWGHGSDGVLRSGFCGA